MPKRIYLTGGLGFLGSHLIPKLLAQNNTLILLVRPSKDKSALDRVREKFGDETAKIVEVVEGDLNDIWVPKTLCNYTKPIDVMLHVAAIVDLGESKSDEVWEANVEGTKKVIDFCRSNCVNHLTLISTAYTLSRNIYELSKAEAEELVKESSISHTIFKPSVVIGSPQEPGPPQTINKVASVIVKVHKRAEVSRRKIEKKIALPPLELAFRIRGNPEATLNLIPVDIVVDAIISSLDKEGTYYITNPNPPTLQEVGSEMREALLLNLHVEQDFTASPPELLLHRLLKSFLTYTQGEPEFPTIIDKDFRLEKGYIRDTVKAFMTQ